MNFELLLLGITGVILHYVRRYKEIIDKKQQLALKSEIPSFIISIILTIVLLYDPIRNSYTDLFDASKPFGALVVGLSNQAIWNIVVTKKYTGVTGIPYIDPPAKDDTDASSS